MITIAVQGQQASQMVEIQGAPQPAEGSGDTFRETFAATVSSVPGGTTQPVASTLRSALGNNVAGSNGLGGKTAAGGESTNILANLSNLTSAAPSSGEAASETVSAPSAASVPMGAAVLAASEDAAVEGPTSGTGANVPLNAAATLKNSASAAVATVALVAGTTLRDSVSTPGTTGSVLKPAKASQSDRKTEAPSSKTAAQAMVNQAGVQTAVLNSAASVPVVAPPATTMQFDLGTKEQALEPEGSGADPIADGSGASVSVGAVPVNGSFASKPAAAQTVVSSYAKTPPIAGYQAAPLASSAEAINVAIETAAPAPAATSSEADSVGAVAAKAASSGYPTTAAEQPVEVGTGAAMLDAGTASESAQFAASIKSATTSAPVSSAAMPVSGTVLKPGGIQGLKAAFTTQDATSAKSNTAASLAPSTRTGASPASPFASERREGVNKVAASDTNQSQPGAEVSQAVAAVQTRSAAQAIASQAIGTVDATRDTAAAIVPAAKETKVKLAADTASTVGGSPSVSSLSANSTVADLSGSDSVTAQKDAAAGPGGSVVAAVALPVAHSAAAPAASVGSVGSGVAVPAVAASAAGAGTRSVGELSGASAGAGTSATASTGATDTGLSADGAASHRTLLATPTTLEVGVPNGTQGWLRIRAEVGGQGEVNASLAAGSSGAQDVLHSQLPALNAYLHSEQMPVTATVADRSFASFTGHAPSGGSGEANGSANSFFQGGAAQSDTGQRQSPPQSATGSDSARGYGGLAGVNEPGVIAALPQSGSGMALSEESGQWLNVRV